MRDACGCNVRNAITSAIAAQVAAVVLLVVVTLDSASMTARADFQGEDLHQALEAAARYVRGFEAQFARIVGEEAYEQRAFSDTFNAKSRTRAEVFFMWLDDAREWLFVRNVVEADGKAIPGRKSIIESIIRGTGQQAYDRFKLLSAENARFNIGLVRRDFNDPVVALLFVDPEYQPRFRFSADGSFNRDGQRGLVVRFDEQTTPTVIGLNGRDMRSRGQMWIASDGTVVQTRLDVENGSITVKFAREPRLDTTVPVSMSERFQTGRQTIIGTANYSKYRRFETSGRIIER